MTPLVSIEHLSKTFPGVRALDDCRFDLVAGEVHALMGEKARFASTDGWSIFQVRERRRIWASASSIRNST